MISSQTLSTGWVHCSNCQKLTSTNALVISCYTKTNKFWHPCLINTIEMRSLSMEIKYIKSTARLLNRVWVNKRGLDLSKEVLWVSVGQRAADLQAVRVGGQQKILLIGPTKQSGDEPGRSIKFFFNLQLWKPVFLLPFDLQRPTIPL